MRTELEIDNILEAHEATIYDIADKFQVAPIHVEQIAHWMLDGKSEDHIVEDLGMEILAAQEWYDCEAEWVMKAAASARKIIATLREEDLESWEVRG